MASSFQSTRPLRGATADSPWVTLSIIFQSTRPLRGATPFKCYIYCTKAISIHAPLTGRDRSYPARRNKGADFNPRAPYGARLERITISIKPNKFQSTRPLRGATYILERDGGTSFVISIHAPLTGRDNHFPRIGQIRVNFNPRAPYGARQQKCTNNLLHFCYNRQFKQKIHLYSIVCKNAIPLYLGICSPNWVRTYLVFFVRLLFAPKQLDHQRIFRHICLFTAEMLDLLFILLP